MKIVTDKIISAVVQLHECVPPQKLKCTLRNLHLEYLAQHPDPLPPELEDMAEELICLFRFLDTIEMEQDPGGETENSL